MKEKYEEVYLIRNERIYKIYNFDDGRPFEPDYLLYFKEKDGKETSQYQLFIEQKGGHLLENDAWKEKCFLSLKQKALVKTEYQNKRYKILGMPFYNENQKSKFIDRLQDFLG